MLDLRKAFATINNDWTIPQDLPYFAGHFPGNPVFPAVGIVDASLALIGKQTGARVFLTGVVAAKFSAPVGPNSRVHIEAASSGEGEWEVDWTDGTDRARKIASLVLKVGAE